MSIAPMPTERVKNAWPTASSSPSAVIGPTWKRKRIASPKPGLQNELTTSRSRIAPSTGIRILVTRSMPLANAQGDDADGDRDEQGVEADLERPVGQEAAESVSQRLTLHVEAPERPAQALAEVVDGPAGDQGVVGEQDEAAGDAESPDRAPGAAAHSVLGGLDEGADRTLPGTPPDHEFGHHDRQADQGDRDQVDEDEGAAVVGVGDVRELPDVAEPDRGADGGEDEPELTEPAAFAGVVCHATSLPVVVVARWRRWA